MLANRRKASAALGDDATLTRFVKTEGFHKSGRKVAPMPEDATGTRFKGRVLRVADAGNLLVSGHNNMKLGRDVRKGKLRGYRIFTLSLEERATCPRSCFHWRDCYGNALHMNKRVDHRDPAFLPALAEEIATLCAKKTGVLIRLHALGDFYSVEYVDFWRDMLVKHPRLSVFGYTARQFETPIGERVARLHAWFSRRWAVRYSNGPHSLSATVSIKTEADCPPDAFVCPEQTGKTRCCATCGACWSTDMNVIDRFKAWARLVPMRPGPMPNGDGRKALGLDPDGNFAMLVIDSNGRVFQIHGGELRDGHFRQVADGRTAVLALLDTLNVQDLPEEFVR